MCAHKQHRYRVEYTVGGEQKAVVVYAKGVAQAVAKADGFAHKWNRGKPVSFTVSHSGYTDDNGAIEHGAIIEA